MKIRIRLIFLTILVFLAVFYFLKVRRDDQKTYFTDNLVVSFFQPVVNGFNGAFGFIPRIYQRYFALINTQSENETLKQAVQLLTLQNDSLKVELQQIHADAAVLNQYAYLNRALLPTRVIGYDPFMQSKTIWINAGSDKSVKVNSVVVAAEGLVGRVIQVFTHSSKVLLLSDSFFSVDTVNQRTKLRCLVQGIDENDLKAQRMPYLSQIEFFERGQEMKEGDLLVTSGVGKMYPSGIPVGHVTEIKIGDAGFFENSLVVPSVDFAKLGSLYVLLDLKK